MPTYKTQRLRHRMLAHHLPLCLFSCVSIVLLYTTRPYTDVLSRASFATAYPALALLAATLLLGPWRILLGRRNSISSDLRRDFGIWAGILGLAHSLIGQNVHLRGRPWLYYIYERRQHKAFPLRHDLFGFANYTGAASSLVLIALLATSNDSSLRALGTPGWKQLQRWNYAVFALAAAHTIAYQTSEKQHAPFVVAAALCIAITIAMQTVGFLRRRTQRANPRPPTQTEPTRA